MATNLNPMHTGPGRQIVPVTGGPGSTLDKTTTALITSGVSVRTVFVGGGDDLYFEQDFTDSSQWHVVHNLGVIPGVSVYDSAGREIIADVQIDSTTATVTWPGPTTGKLVLS